MNKSKSDGAEVKPALPSTVLRFGWIGLLDSEGKAYIEAGIKYLKLSEAELMGRIERDPALLRLPLVRSGKAVSIGHDEASWKAMLAAPGG